jgi:hypothetical protein
MGHPETLGACTPNAPPGYFWKSVFGKTVQHRGNLHTCVFQSATNISHGIVAGAVCPLGEKVEVPILVAQNATRMGHHFHLPTHRRPRLFGFAHLVIGSNSKENES